MTSISTSAPLYSQNDLEDFLEKSLCGYVTTNSKGKITQVNSRLANWLGYAKDDLIQKSFSSLLEMGGRIFYETHLFPLLKLQGSFEEVSTELLLKNGQTFPVLINGYLLKDEKGTPECIRLTVYKAHDRSVYENNLRQTIDLAQQKLEDEKALAVLREQFIAVLGHDLRNPLGAIKSGSYLLSRSSLSERDAKLVAMMQGSALRMQELIDNVMDFARVRLGGGLNLNIETKNIAQVIRHTINEVLSIFPERQVLIDIEEDIVIPCDSDRISQLLSNLVANAMTHGTKTLPVKIEAKINKEIFTLSVVNGGHPIPENKIASLFEPFTREADSPSQQGLGLGLYIASQIAAAHNGTLTAASNSEQTSFTFDMSI